MTRQQKNLVRYWVFSGSLLLAAIGSTLLGEEYGQAVFPALMALLVLVSCFQDFSYYRGFGDGSKSLGAFVEAHPGLKIWLIGYSVFVLPLMIYKMQASENLSGILYFLSFFLLLGPVAVVSEIERFRSMA